MHRNVLRNNYIINKFVDTINGFLCIRIVGGHSFFDMVSQFSTEYFTFSQIWNYDLNMSLSRYHYNIKTVQIC